MPELITLPELAEYLRFTRKTIYSLVKQEKIPAIKIGRQWRFDKDQIDQWLQGDTSVPHTGLLVIDNDLSVSSLINKTLRGKGYRIVTAATGTEGIDAVKNLHIHLVFLNLELPDISGGEVFRKIAAINPSLPVVIINGYHDRTVMAQVMNQGPFGVMSKPFDGEAIINITNTYRSLSRAGSTP